jgi:hypothetical protein
MAEGIGVKPITFWCLCLANKPIIVIVAFLFNWWGVASPLR